MDGELKFNLADYGEDALGHLERAVCSNWTSGNGHFTREVHAFFKSEFGLDGLLTHSCTAALEMMALLLDLQPGDEVIVPSFTFVSTATAFDLHGARLVFADSDPEYPHLSLDSIQAKVTERTKAVCVVHYAGAAHEIEDIRDWLEPRGIVLLEDAAQAVGSSCTSSTGERIPLGRWGAASSMSFHETKNVACGQGGALFIQREDWRERSMALWEKGTNRQAFFLGLVDKYGWVDKGSSFLASDITAALLYSQLLRWKDIHERRMAIWHRYDAALRSLEAEGRMDCMRIPPGSDHNAHMYYLLLPGFEARAALMKHLKSLGIQSTFHYQSLHRSPYVLRTMGEQPACPHSDRYSDGLLRLPLHLKMGDADVDRVIDGVRGFFTA